MSRRKGNPKVGAAAVGVIALVVAMCCGIVTSGGDDKPPADRAPAQVVEVTTPAVEPTTEEPEPEPEPVEDVDTDDDDDDAPVKGVHPGAYCSPEGAYGLTSAGTRMRCKGPGRARWRRA